MSRAEIIAIMAAILWARREGINPTTAVVDAEMLLASAEEREATRRAKARGEYQEPAL